MTNRLKVFPSSLFLLLAFFAFNPVKVYGQGTGTQITPDCAILINITLSAQTTVDLPAVPTSGGAGDNRTTGCQTYTLSYQATGTGSLTGLSFQSGQSSTTTVSFADWAGTVATGINPNTSSTGATSTFSTGCISTVECNVPNSWLRILITRGTFVGTINGVLYGYKTGASGGGGGGGGGGGCTSPCPVEGVTAAGSPPTTPPVLVSGQDGTPGNIRTLKTDGNGSPIPSNASSAAGDAVSNTELFPTGAGAAALYARMFGFLFGGSTWDREYSCPNSATITFSAASGTLEIVALTSSQIIRICHVSLSSTVATNITLVYGTGSNCGTGTTSISGAYQGVTTLALDFRIGAEPRTAASNAFCITSSVSATVGGMVTYAKF